MSKEHWALLSFQGTQCTSVCQLNDGKKLRREAQRIYLSILSHTAASKPVRASTETSAWRSRRCCTESMIAKLGLQMKQRRSSSLCVPLPVLATSCFRSIDSSSENGSQWQAPSSHQYWSRVRHLSRSWASYEHTGVEVLCSSQSYQRERLAWLDGSWSGTSSSRLWELLEATPFLLCVCTLQARLTWRSKHST